MIRKVQKVLKIAQLFFLEAFLDLNEVLENQESLFSCSSFLNGLAVLEGDLVFWYIFLFGHVVWFDYFKLDIPGEQI